jgi:hypothetical protein
VYLERIGALLDPITDARSRGAAEEKLPCSILFFNSHAVDSRWQEGCPSRCGALPPLCGESIAQALVKMAGGGGGGRDGGGVIEL